MPQSTQKKTINALKAWGIIIPGLNDLRGTYPARIEDPETIQIRLTDNIRWNDPIFS